MSCSHARGPSTPAQRPILISRAAPVACITDADCGSSSLKCQSFSTPFSQTKYLLCVPAAFQLCEVSYEDGYNAGGGGIHGGHPPTTPSTPAQTCDGLSLYGAQSLTCVPLPFDAANTVYGVCLPPHIPNLPACASDFNCASGFSCRAFNVNWQGATASHKYCVPSHFALCNPSATTAVPMSTGGQSGTGPTGANWPTGPSAASASTGNYPNFYSSSPGSDFGSSTGWHHGGHGGHGGHGHHHTKPESTLFSTLPSYATAQVTHLVWDQIKSTPIPTYGQVCVLGSLCGPELECTLTREGLTFGLCLPANTGCQIFRTPCANGQWICGTHEQYTSNDIFSRYVKCAASPSALPPAPDASTCPATRDAYGQCAFVVAPPKCDLLACCSNETLFSEPCQASAGLCAAITCPDACNDVTLVWNWISESSVEIPPMTVFKEVPMPVVPIQPDVLVPVFQYVLKHFPHKPWAGCNPSETCRVLNAAPTCVDSLPRRPFTDPPMMTMARLPAPLQLKVRSPRAALVSVRRCQPPRHRPGR